MEALRVKNGKDIIFRQEEEDAFIFTPEDSAIRILNETGALVWKMIEKGKSYDEVLKALKDEYPEIKESKIKNDLDTFLRETKKRELIED